MKTQIITLLTLLLCLTSVAQKDKKEKIKALKIAHITEQLNLTETEAQAFWPIYNDNEAARVKLREVSGFSRKKEGIASFTETEARAFIDTINKTEDKRVELNKAYYKKLFKVLSAKKIVALIQADRSFRKKMIKEFKSRHGSRK